MGGAAEIVCNDSHGTTSNLDPAALHGHATYVSGRHKPLYMMQGLDALHPEVAQMMIAAGARRAVERAADSPGLPTPAIALPATL